jgi:hypothetical protein
LGGVIKERAGRLRRARSAGEARRAFEGFLNYFDCLSHFYAVSVTQPFRCDPTCQSELKMKRRDHSGTSGVLGIVTRTSSHKCNEINTLLSHQCPSQLPGCLPWRLLSPMEDAHAKRNTHSPVLLREAREKACRGSEDSLGRHEERLATRRSCDCTKRGEKWSFKGTVPSD